jgi:hypothetical protein
MILSLGFILVINPFAAIFDDRRIVGPLPFSTIVEMVGNIGILDGWGLAAKGLRARK